MFDDSKSGELDSCPDWVERVFPIRAGDPVTRFCAIDCEMDEHSLTGKMIVIKAALVNVRGQVLLDTLVEPEVPLEELNSLSRIHGITHQDLRNEDSLPSIEKVRDYLVDLIDKGVILVGQSICHDLRCLGLLKQKVLPHLTHISCVDTADYAAISRRKESLRSLAKSHLGIDIQSGTHCPVEDALATIAIFNKHRKFFEKVVRQEKLDPIEPKRRPRRKKPRPPRKLY